jgi:hypothetical protein
MLQFAPEYLRNDHFIATTAITQNCFSYYFISPDLKSNSELQTLALENEEHSHLIQEMLP